VSEQHPVPGMIEGRQTLRAVVVAIALAAALLSASSGVGEAGPDRFAGPRLQAGPAGATKCDAFPAANIWNQRVDTLPVHSSSAEWVRSVGDNERLRALFSASDGTPFQVVGGSTEPAIVLMDRADDSDPGPYRLRDDTPLHAGTGRVLIVDGERCCPPSFGGATGRAIDLEGDDRSDLRSRGERSAPGWHAGGRSGGVASLSRLDPA
jgi:hypothetical protein